MSAEVSTEARIQDYLRFAAAHGRDTERIGPFLATFTLHSDNPYLNYAIPDDGSTPSANDVSVLIAAYESRSRIPRLEYTAQLAPAVEPALIAQGFAVEGRTPLMICARGSARHLPTPAGIELLVPNTGDELLGTIAAQNEAYGGGPPNSEDVARLRASMQEGTIVVLARDAATGEPAGGGVCTIPRDGVTEVAGIGVRPRFRRRGIAGALTVRLAEEAFKTGVSLAFLMAAHDAEARIYARAGFTAIGEVLHISHSVTGSR